MKLAKHIDEIDQLLRMGFALERAIIEGSHLAGRPVRELHADEVRYLSEYFNYLGEERRSKKVDVSC